MANNYTPSYNQYLTQTAGYVLPSSVRSYSVFDPSSNSWRRMTNDGRSPMPAQGQTPIADALALARQTQGRDWSAQPAPAQVPAQTPLGSPRMASNRQSRDGMGVPASQPSASPRGASMSPEEAVAFGIAVQNPGADLQAQPRVFMPLESRYENFQQEIPRSNLYGPLQNPRTVRNMSPDYQEASAAPVVVAQPAAPAAPAAPTQAATPTVRAVGYPTTDIFGDEMYWRTKAHRLGENDAYWNEKKRHVGQLLDAAAHATPVLAPFGYAGAVTRGLIAPRGLAVYGINTPIEPLAKVMHRTAGTVAPRVSLTPQAQKVADSLKFTFNH